MRFAHQRLLPLVLRLGAVTPPAYFPLDILTVWYYLIRMRLSQQSTVVSSTWRNQSELIAFVLERNRYRFRGVLLLRRSA